MAYKHGTYGVFAKSIGAAAVKSGTVAVYVGAAPVHLTKGFAAKVNKPILLHSMAEARSMMGYTDNWADFDLCEAFSAHFNNPLGNVGPIVAVNVLDPAADRTQSQTSSVTFTNGVGRIHSDTVVIDTLELAGKTKGTNFTVDYDFDHGDVVISSVAEPLSGSIEATYDVVTPATVEAQDIIGGVTAEGVYTGLGCISQIDKLYNLVPNLIVCPKWSSDPTVYAAMLEASEKINGHWDAMVYADIPIAETDTIAKAKAWKTTNAYNSERSKVFWPQAVDAAGHKYHLSVLGAWLTMKTDAANNDIPMESPSNKPLPVIDQYFGADSTNAGFDQQTANQLNAVGITTVVYWGGRTVLWGPHTAAFTDGVAGDNRSIFDSSVRLMMHVSNSFQREHGLIIDQPMTVAMSDTIRNREQEKMDALAAAGAFIGRPVVSFLREENNRDDLVRGDFVWSFEGTPTPPFKSGTLKVAYTDAGFTSYFEEV